MMIRAFRMCYVNECLQNHSKTNLGAFGFVGTVYNICVKHLCYITVTVLATICSLSLFFPCPVTFISSHLTLACLVTHCPSPDIPHHSTSFATKPCPLGFISWKHCHCLTLTLTCPCCPHICCKLKIFQTLGSVRS